MMRKLFFVSTAVFCLSVIGLGLLSLWLPGASLASPGADRPVPKAYTMADIARHARRDDCWMAINGQVYDLTAYLPQHPADPELMLAWCGREASEAYRTKTKGRPHSPYADQQLAKFRIGEASSAR